MLLVLMLIFLLRFSLTNCWNFFFIFVYFDMYLFCSLLFTLNVFVVIFKRLEIALLCHVCCENAIVIVGNYEIMITLLKQFCL